VKEVAKFAIVLALFALAAGLSLSVTYTLSQPPIQRQEELKLQTALTSVLPGAERFEEKDGVYKGYAGANLVGCVYQVSRYGYGSDIQTLIGVDLNHTITGMQILSHSETPGLGSRITEVRPGDKAPWFTNQFIGKTRDDLTFSKNGGKIDAVTGATLSSRAVLDSAREAAEHASCT
jgi:Na+-translocating ferredoxin:NAD+ oxidoreductase subunit G